jgi:hypothetical protein
MTQSGPGGPPTPDQPGGPSPGGPSPGGPPPGGPSQPPAQPPQSPYGQQPPAPGQGYPAPAYAYPVQQTQGTNGFAIASLICAFLCWPLGLVFGFIARSQIQNTREGGSGLALAGIIVSFVALAVTVIYIVLIVAFFHTVSNLNNFPIFTPTP